MAFSWMLRRVALVRTEVLEELSASFIRVSRISELGITLAVTSVFLVHWFLSPWWRRRYVTPKRRFLQEPHGVTSQKTQFFIVTAVKTPNLTCPPVHRFTLHTVSQYSLSIIRVSLAERRPRRYCQRRIVTGFRTPNASETTVTIAL
jgi:hypothetical protein